MSTEKELLVMNKLEYLKEIRYRMAEIDRMRSCINEELDLVNVEERCLQEYRREMDSLYQEKMTHVEELRQIHSDINMLENVLKQSEEDRNRHVDNVKRLHNHLQQIKDGVEKMRAEIGLPTLAHNQNDKHDDAAILDKLHAKTSINTSHTTQDKCHSAVTKSCSTTTITGQSHGSSSSASTNVNKPLSDNTNTGSLSSHLPSFMSHQYNRFGSLISASSAAGGHQAPSQQEAAVAANAVVASSSAAAAAAAFRQQPPPMKSCLSCHQQIHRNAPICPLCKAKSRSRHPKRRNHPKN